MASWFCKYDTILRLDDDHMMFTIQFRKMTIINIDTCVDFHKHLKDKKVNHLALFSSDLAFGSVRMELMKSCLLRTHLQGKNTQLVHL